MDKVTLLPCPNPWCDCPNDLTVEPILGTGMYGVECGCGFNGPALSTPNLAEAAWNTRATPAPDSEKLREAGDYRLGLDRAAHECEWMARGYAAHLMQPLLDAAERIREIPNNPDDEPHCKRRDGRKPALGASA